MAPIILLIQDDPRDAEEVRAALMESSRFRVDWVRTCTHGLARLNAAARAGPRVAAVLIDLWLPDVQGLETFERLYQAAFRIPILVLHSMSFAIHMATRSATICCKRSASA